MAMEYDFNLIFTKFDKIDYETKNTLESVSSSVDSLSTDVEEVSGDLSYAKSAITFNLNEAIQALETSVLRGRNVASSHEQFDSTDLSIMDLFLASRNKNSYINLPETSAPEDILAAYNSQLGLNSDKDKESDKSEKSETNETYTVVAGDTLSEIAQEKGVPLSDVIEANKDTIKDPNLILVGQQVIVPGVAAATSDKTESDEKTSKEKNNSKEESKDKTKNEKSKEKDKSKEESKSSDKNETKKDSDKSDKIANQTSSKYNVNKEVDVPDGLGNTHTYMGWQLITAPDSNQYRFREDVGMNFDSEGFGIVDDRYVIACTTTYGNVGDLVDFVKTDGTVLKCVIGDIKSQSDAGCNQWGHSNGNNIVEFIVDKNSWYNSNHSNPGTTSCHPEWNHGIEKAINYGSYYDYN